MRPGRPQPSGAGADLRGQRIIGAMNALNVAEYMQTLGLQARQAASRMAAADAASRNRALRLLAGLLREQRVWGLKERLFERVLPRLTATALDNLLYSAHLVDGIVKGLKVPDWPAEDWQALHRLAFALCQECVGATGPAAPQRARG